MELFIIIGLILLNGLLSMSEIALVSARKTRLELNAKNGKSTARTALRLMNQPDKFLSTIQIGITLIGILTGLYSGEAFAYLLADYVREIPVLEPYALGVSKTTIVILVTYFTLVFGELVPKRVGMASPETIAMVMAKPMEILSKISSPFVWLLSKSTALAIRVIGGGQSENNKVTEEEIKAVVQEGLDGGEVQEVEQDIVERVFYLGDRNVGSIMTHRNELICLDMQDSIGTVRQKVNDNLFDLYPVVSGSYDNVKGVVYLKDLFVHMNDDDFSLDKLLHPAQFMPENQSVYDALEQFKQAKVKYGIVTDEFGSVEGIVTLKDIMEGLVGQVQEAGEEPEIFQRPDGSWLVDGQYAFYDFLQQFDMEDLYSDYDYNTLSGLILDILKKVPATGERLSWLNLDMEIVDMDGARIDKVLVHVTKKETDGDE